MLELRERIKHQLEKEDQLNKFQIQEIINESMHIIRAKERVNADQQRPKLDLESKTECEKIG
jgi:hypothetical protein